MKFPVRYLVLFALFQWLWMSLQNYWVNAEVTQGSIFGLTLFLPYINDPPDNVISNVAVYADDITLYSKCYPSVNFWPRIWPTKHCRLGLDVDDEFPWQVHTLFQQGRRGWGQKIEKKVWEVAKNFSLIRREGGANFFSCFSWGKGGVETPFCGICTSLTAMLLLTYDLSSFEPRINKQLLSLDSF